MKPHGKTTTILASLGLVALTVTGCSSDDDTATASGQEAAQDLDSLLLPDARGDQQAAGAGTLMAVDLGFDQVQLATETEITAVQETAADRNNAAEELAVEPAECTNAIAALDWSPILASSEAITRVDFSTGNFQGAGSIEVAGITDATGGSQQAAQQVEDHRQAVQDITTRCNMLTMMLADETEPDWAAIPYTFTAEPVETDSGSGLRWQRHQTEDAEAQHTAALTLMTEHEGYVIMVAFIGGEEIYDTEFIDISETILASAIAQLD